MTYTKINGTDHYGGRRQIRTCNIRCRQYDLLFLFSFQYYENTDENTLERLKLDSVKLLIIWT